MGIETILLIAGAGLAGAAAGGAFSGGGGGGIPSRPAETVTKTAERVDTGSEAARRNRKRRRASLLTRDFGEPQLGQSGLTGVT